MPKIDIATLEREGTGNPPKFNAHCAERIPSVLATRAPRGFRRQSPAPAARQLVSQRHWRSHEDVQPLSRFQACGIFPLSATRPNFEQRRRQNPNSRRL